MEKSHIVVVDDEDAILEAVGKMLRQDGHRADLFRSSMLALEACLARPPRFLITDYLIAEMTGEDLARALRAELGDRAPKIVCITGWLLELRPDQLMMFDRTLEKPFAYRDLVSLLEDIDRADSDAGLASGDTRLPWIVDPAGSFDGDFAG